MNPAFDPPTREDLPKRLRSLGPDRPKRMVFYALVGLTALGPASAEAQAGFRAWVGLYDPASLGWLENENRLGELCSDPATLDVCYAAHLAPRLSVYSLYAEPDTASRRIGELIVAAVPGRGLSAHFRATGADTTVPVAPDLYLQDWGYGPYFHHTVSEQSGNWFQLPRRPWPDAVWIRRDGEREYSTVITVTAGDIIELRGSSWYVVAAEPDTLVVRAEQAADLWCEEGDPPAITPAERVRWPRPALLDQDGHLLFRLKYLKGC